LGTGNVRKIWTIEGKVRKYQIKRKRQIRQIKGKLDAL
jgi:hypothetical protein